MHTYIHTHTHTYVRGTGILTLHLDPSNIHTRTYIHICIYKYIHIHTYVQDTGILTLRTSDATTLISDIDSVAATMTVAGDACMYMYVSVSVWFVCLRRLQHS